MLSDIEGKYNSIINAIRGIKNPNPYPSFEEINEELKENEDFHTVVDNSPRVNISFKQIKLNVKQSYISL